jgi:phosphoribosylformylglycinamidine synthase
MNTYKAEIKIMPLKNLLDPQGKAVSSNIKNVGIPQISNVRIGKHIVLDVVAEDESKANDIVRDACKKILANEIMEFFEFNVSKY